jgi:hypothetical protein
VTSNPEEIRTELTAENALERLRLFACPVCETIGQFETFRHPTTNHVGLRCTACRLAHPFRLHRIQWLRQNPPRRSNDIQAVMDARGHYCWLCSASEEQLIELGIGMHVHHTLPFAYNGDKVEKIPLCAVCHEIARALQRHHGGFRQAVRE